ncbi:hypothetical protein KI688_001700 [Linnemannia hyalina]|uniref:Uncharacterized protein n=1 Tax=Linnemannia hyalina TaxID=64524 RepID=A0A9P8BRW5_9FUNG|nr:hypothetical protein KI688_001700 [Linnemannia hyalina]
MILTPSISSAAKLITLSMALLAVLSVINTPAVHAAPISNPGAPLVNGVKQADPEAFRVPVGPRGPLLNRRGSGIAVSGVKETSGLGKTHPSAVEKPDPSSSELSMHPGHATKRDDDEEMLELLGKARWMEKRDETTSPAGGEWKDVVGVTMRSDPALDEKRKDDSRWSLISRPNIFPVVAVTKRGDGKDEAPESIWREWNGKGGAAGRFEVRVVMTSHIEGKGKGNGAAKKRQLKTEQKKRNVDDRFDAAGAAAGSQKDIGELETLEKKKFRTWHFKREE